MIFLVLPISWKFALNATQKERIMTFLFRVTTKRVLSYQSIVEAIASGGLTGIMPAIA